MKDSRTLVRVAPRLSHVPSEQAALLDRIRRLLAPLNGKAINLRVTPVALEFDLFCPPEQELAPLLSALAPFGEVVTCKRLDGPEPAREAQTIIDEARQLVNEQRYWEVHETLEGLWRKSQGAEKDLVQGLILLAAAHVHAQKNEAAVVEPLLAQALARLGTAPARFRGWNLDGLRAQVKASLENHALFDWRA